MGADPERLPYGYAIVGAQKAGTSLLADTLNEHPGVCAPPHRAAHYFDDEGVDWEHPDYERDYTAPGCGAGELVVGDASATYIFWPGALERMQRYNPDMPLIAIFRDPMERLFSHWMMLRARSDNWGDWADMLARMRTLARRGPSSRPGRDGSARARWQDLTGISRGFYGEQLRRGFALFERDRWLLLETHELTDSYAATIDRVTDFLGLPRFDGVPPMRVPEPTPPVRGSAPSGEEILALARLHAEDLDEFSSLCDLDVSHWPTRRILAGDLDPAVVAAGFASRLRPL